MAFSKLVSQIHSVARDGTSVRGERPRPSAVPPLKGPSWCIEYTDDANEERAKQLAYSLGHLMWMGEGLKLKSPLVCIADPLTYISAAKPPSQTKKEPSAIDLYLDVAERVQQPAGRELPYWPNYEQLSPNQRRIYLDWLGGRSRLVPPEVGYAFIFMYGLERRALIDRQDVRLVARELIRLRRTYDRSGQRLPTSFERYTSQLLWFLLLREPATFLLKDLEILGRTCTCSREESLAAALSWLAVSEHALPVWLAFNLAAHLPTSRRSVVSRRVGNELKELFEKRYAEQHGGGSPLRSLKRERKFGYDFVTVLQRYYRAHLTGNEQTKTAAVRWLRGEYGTKTEARQDLGVRAIIDDDTFYDYLKLFARFAKVAGYAGFIVCLDELVVLSHRLNNRVARNNNYEAILRILNDCTQGNVQYLGFIFAATDECLSDKRRGLFSYEALSSRLAVNRFAQENLVDLGGPVLALATLKPEDLYVLLLNIRRVHCAGDSAKQVLPDEGIEKYLQSCSQRMGAAYYQTPREVVKDFIGLLNVLQQNPSAHWRDLIGQITTGEASTVDPSVAAALPDDDLVSFKL